jgi:hypothetical protein
VYHRFGDAKHASTNTSLHVLEKQFQYFKEHNYKVIPLKTLNAALQRKEKIPDNWVVFCVDDSGDGPYGDDFISGTHHKA